MNTRLRSEKRLLSLGISFSILLQFLAIPQVSAQTLPAVPAPPAQALPTDLGIVVLEGEGAVLDVHQRAGKDPVVRVEDQSQKPISGAVVVFTLPTEGATGEFSTGGKSVTVTTDAQGVATGKGLKINQVPGKLQIHVTVSYKGLSGRTNIVEFVEGPAIHGTKGVGGGGGKGKWIAILLVVGGGAAGGAAYALSSKNSTTSTPGVVTPPPAGPAAIGITPGTGTISPPR